MKHFRSVLTAAAFAMLGSVAMGGSASAGTWYLNAASCPDLREDRRDRRYYEGRWDVREDRRDRRVIECPPRSWTYVMDRWERRHGIERGSGGRRGTPGIVYQTRNGEYFRVNRRGERRFINVVVEYPRWRRARHYDRRWRHERRGWRDRPYRHHPY